MSDVSKELMKIYYKLARPDGYDWYTGKSINYRESIGKTVKVKDYDLEPELCSSSVLHACLDINECFVGAKIPCSVFRVQGVPVIGEDKKYGFKEFLVVEEVEPTDELFGWKYAEACNPVHPFKIASPKITKEHIALLKKWSSVGDSVRASIGASIGDSAWVFVGDSIGASIGDSVGDSVRASIGASVGDSAWVFVGDSIGASAWASIWASVRDSIWAYIGSLFPNIKKWKYLGHVEGEYPFQSAVDLWRQGLVPSFDGKTWRFHGGEKCNVLFEISSEKLEEETEQ